ncbi:MAG: hypothetical protein H7318_15040 [Oligoflexus sp.]|nr:hypothetical protein [Oligoflexus sp.]
MGASGLGSLLVKEGFLTEQDRLTITKTCGQGSWAFAKSILAIGLLDEDELAAFFAERTRYQIAPKDFLNHLDQSAIHALDRRLVSKLEVIPLKKAPGKITVGVVDPLDRSTLKQLEFFTGLEVDPVVIPLSQLYKGLVRIDPDFRLQATALTHFLQNHAQSAWVRQKLDIDEATPEASRRAMRSSGSDIDELYDDLPEIEEVEDDEIEEVEEIDEAVEDEEAEIALEGEEAGVDPFAGLSESHDDDLGAEIAARSTPAAATDDLLEMVGDDEIEEEVASENSSDESATHELDFDMDLSGSEEEFAKTVKASNDFDMFDDVESEAAKAATPAEDDDFTFGEEPTKEASPTSGSDALDAMAFDEDEDEGGLKDAMAKIEASPQTSTPDILTDDNSDINFEMDDIAPQSNAGQPLSNFGFEETKPRAISKPQKSDILDNLDDHEPSLDISALASEPVDDELLADLHAEIEADDHSPNVKFAGPNTREHDEPEAFSPLPASRSKAREPSFTDDDDETHIDLRPSLAASGDLDDEDDILLHPKAKAQEQDSGLNPTSALNEVMLKLSLCWNPQGVIKVLQGSLYKIGDAGCLINTKSQKQILWCGGRLISEELGPAALLPMLKGASNNRWNNMDLKASESWAQKPLKLRIFRSGDWLWAHQLKIADDTGIFRDTVESTVSQIADKLGAG